MTPLSLRRKLQRASLNTRSNCGKERLLEIQEPLGTHSVTVGDSRRGVHHRHGPSLGESRHTGSDHCPKPLLDRNYVCHGGEGFREHHSTVVTKRTECTTCAGLLRNGNDDRGSQEVWRMISRRKFNQRKASCRPPRASGIIQLKTDGHRHVPGVLPEVNRSSRTA